MITVMGNKTIFCFDSKFVTYESEIFFLNLFAYKSTELKTLCLPPRWKDLGDEHQNCLVHIRDAPYR